MTSEPLLRVCSIQVDGLFDLFDHRIDLKLEDRVTILHGPNGVGKTMLLRMASDLLSGRYSVFRQVPFRRFALRFTDDTRLELTADRAGEKANTLRSATRSPSPSLRLTLFRGNQKQESHEVSRNEDLQIAADSIANHFSWIRQISDDEWLDEREGHVMSVEDLVSLYADTGQLYTSGSGVIGPEWLRQLREAVAVHLIEAQRLFRLNAVEPRGYRQRRRTIFRVIDCAQDLQALIRETMAKYGQQSQRLDQTFPQRLLVAPPTPLNAEDIKARMDELDARRSELKDIGLLDRPEVHPFDTKTLDTLDTTRQSVMSLYVQDTTQKLQVLDDLARRTRLLLDNVNRKFLHKRIRIDRDLGLIAERKDGSPLKLEALSSGEQHELVLHYDLLFRVRPNTLVLIDEPELSLHVAWQKRFLPDLLEIVATARFDAVIATHSPFIVGDRADLLIGLNAELV
jgi:ABC-type lipoprotein export system ATPase subunit